MNELDPLATRLQATARSLPTDVSADVRGDGPGQFLYCVRNGRAAELSEDGDETWVEFWEAGADYAVREATFCNHLEAAISVSDWLGADWDATSPPLGTTDERFLSIVNHWIATAGEILVVFRYVYGAGSRSFEFFRDSPSLQQRLAQLRAADSVIVFRERQLPLRGRVDDAFIEVARNSIPDGAEYLITRTTPMSAGKMTWFYNAAGSSHAELEEDLRFEACFGEEVAVGLEPPYSWGREGVLAAWVPEPDGSFKLGAY